ncbi:MAG: hypothetical protein K2V38_26655, partial [Gemmataceae bacterium]|nr:hypothetical protein [Gemmataceae bacterium]
MARGGAFTLPLVLVACQSLIKPEQCGPGGLVPECHKNPTLEAVACDIDHIEKHIDLWGSITTKHPDVWGSARLTKYQQEVERIFVQESRAENVDFKISAYQGARARTDQAVLLQALAINAALTGQQAGLIPPDPVTVVTGTRTTYNKNVTDGTAGNSASSDTSSGSTANVSSSGGGSAGSTGSASNTNKQGVSQSQNTTTKTGADGQQTANTSVPPAVGIPNSATIPTDFTSGTAVSLTRNAATLPTLPGFGAGGLRLEPTVVLDEKKRFLDHLNQIRRVNEGDDTSDSPGYALYLVRVPVSVLPGKRTDTGHGAEITMSIKPIIGDDLLPATFRNLVINDLVDQFSELMTVALNSDRKQLTDALGDQSAEQVNDKAKLNQLLSRVKPKYTATRPSRNAEYAFPMNHLEELFGETFVKALIVAAVNRYKAELDQGNVIHLHEVRAAVREQIVAGYRFLNTGNPHAWSLCTQDLARAVRDVNGDTGAPAILHTYKDQYDKMLGREIKKDKDITSDRLVAKALGWAVLIESALLTEQLIRDMKETATHKGCPCPAEGWLDYYLPNPSAEARRAFNEYVACRWPMYTFAVDPVTEQQNIQDTLSQRREFQLALSLAFASGAISAQSFTRYARRLEADYQTVELNRTVVGFSHGDNTFGWRFYPRFQPPEIPGNLKLITRDLIGGRAFTKQQEIRQRRLEPGQRECVALVIMPSFVPFAEINVSSSWF